MSRMMPLEKAIKKYYEEHFSPKDYENVVSTSPYGNREFGFQLKNGLFLRNRSFSDRDEFLRYLKVNGPIGVYSGAVYDQPLSDNVRIQDAEWIGRELVFDFDINEYDAVRLCGCTGRQYCPKCWGLLQDAAIFLDETLREDFGFKHLVWVFTGGRGIHCWIRDTEVFYLTQKQRNAVVSYMSLIHDPKGDQRVDPLPSAPKLLTRRIYSKIITSFIINTELKDLRKLLGFPKKKIELLKNEVKMFIDTGVLVNPIGNTLKNTERELLIKTALLYRYPRIDYKVTIDTRRILRIPGSIHGSTGMISEIITDPASFYPDDALSVYDVL